MSDEGSRDEHGERASEAGRDSPDAERAARSEPGPGASGPGAPEAPGGVPPGSSTPPGSGGISPGPPPGGTPRPGLPWEVREREGAVQAALSTVRMALLSPGAAFGRMRQTGQLGDAIVYLLIFGTLGAFFALLWQSWTRAMFGSWFGADLGTIAATNTGAVFMLLITPVFVLVASAIYALVIHVLLLLFGGAPQPLETTWKTLCYASGSAYVFNILPFCGNLIASVWGLVVVIIGIREAQEVPGGRAAAAVLVPVLLLCACLMAMVVLAIATGAALAGLG